MRMLGRLVEVLKLGAGGKRTWTPSEVRELIRNRDLVAAGVAANHLSPSLKERGAEKACLIGEIAFHENKDAAASAAFHEALAAVPGMPAAHYGLSLLMAERQDFDSALQHAKFALTTEPKEPRILAQVGYCHLALGNLQLAETPLRSATRLDPENASAWNNLGIVMQAKGRAAEAVDCFMRALALKPGFEAARQHLNQVEEALAKKEPPVLGTATSYSAMNAQEAPVILQVRGIERDVSIDRAIDACESLSVESPDNAALVIELQRLYERVGDPQSGIDALEAFLIRHPADYDITAALGLAQARAQNHGEAERHLTEALKLSPDRPDLLLALSQAVSAQGRYADCMPLVERALALAPEDETIRGAHIAALTNCCRYEEALAICEQLQRENKESACYGTVLANLGRFEDATEWLNRALVAQPSDPNLRFQRAHVHLLRNRFAQGWDDYTYRGLSNSKDFRVLPFPCWRGEPLEGKRIVVLAEQGLGDQVMFASCLHDLLALKPTEVVVEVIGRIAPTIERSFPDCRIIATKQDSKIEWVKDLVGIDYYVPLGDLPKYFRRREEDFPRHSGYLLPNPERVEHWRKALQALGRGPYIGLSWRGGTETTRTTLRTISPTMLAPLRSATDAKFVCLQYGDVSAPLKEASGAGLEMGYWPQAISNLDEFSALISALDLVITVCNTTVHYAGAVGKPVWVLAPKVPEWRYGLTSSSMPWYPSSTMFRQQVAGEWEPTIGALCQKLLTQYPPA